MSLSCLNDIITKNLAINIDLTNINSWDFNSGLTVYSLSKWSEAKSDNINLLDYGLTAFDIGKTDKMWDSKIIYPTDLKLSLTPIKYNTIQNPNQWEYSGVTVTNNILSISGISDNNFGNYFELNGGYLNGFFKLHDYNYELLPNRYNKGITIETLLYLYPESYGIFYYMGTRSEDKYNPNFSGETITGGSLNNIQVSGVVTSEDDYLEAISETQTIKNAFGAYEDRLKTSYINESQVKNISNNVISFEITTNNKLAYKYINENGQLIYNESNNQITNTGWTVISITFKPNRIFDDVTILDCYKQRIGDLKFYVNGRLFWLIKEFPEFYFHKMYNDREKQIGVPYNINWGGGSFGLENSYHYNKQTYQIYSGNNSTYINQNFIVESNPDPSQCDPYSGGTQLNGFLLQSNNTGFTYNDICDPTITYPLTVMQITYTGGTSANTYFIKFNNPINVISNREYDVSLDIYNNEIFKQYDHNNNRVISKIYLTAYGTEEINIINEKTYDYPIKTVENGSSVTGDNKWLNINTKLSIKENTGKQTIYLGVVIETTNTLNLNKTLYIKDFTYNVMDVLSQDSNKENLFIEQNFNSSFIGKIQKLRIYDVALNSQEILHNALIENNNNINLNLNITKGGRVIYR
jgi:hypothetical protein